MDNIATPEVINHILKYKRSLVNGDFIIDMFVSCNKLHITDYDLKDNTLTVYNKSYFNLVPGKLITLENDKSETYYTITSIIDRDVYYIINTDIPISDTITQLASFHDTFMLSKGLIQNYNEPKPIETTLGNFYFNYVFLTDIFGKLFPYDNEIFDSNKYEKAICQYAIEGKVTAKQIKTYIDRLMYLSKFGPMIFTTTTEKLLACAPEFEKYKTELLKQYKDKLNDPEIVIEIEDKLISKLKELLKDDPSEFFITKKMFNVVLKRMFVGFGYLEPFGEIDPKPKFLTSTLDTGIKKDEIPELFNEIRRGSFGRARDSAKGGALLKFLVRTFQSAEIVMNDCGTKKGITVVITNNNKDEFLYRYAIINNKLVLLTTDNIDTYLNKSLTIRSPMYCKAELGFCFKCLGAKYEKLNIKRLAAEILEIGSTFLNISMSSIHGTKTSLTKIQNINNYLL